MFCIFPSHDSWWGEFDSLWLLVNMEKNEKNDTSIKCLTLICPLSYSGNQFENFLNQTLHLGYLWMYSHEFL